MTKHDPTDVGNQTQGEEPAWPDDRDSMEAMAQRHVLSFINSLERRPLRELDSIPDLPGAYWLFRSPRRSPNDLSEAWCDRLYAAFSSGRRPVYVGKATSTGLRSRLCLAR